MKTIQNFLAGASITCVALLGSVGVTSAATITSLTGFSTTGSGMSGMEVTVNFQNGTSSTALWAATGFGSGGASTGGWTLTQSGNTFFNPWTFSNNTGSTISSLFINAILGNTVFDIDPRLSALYSTAGSADGIKFEVDSGVAPTSFQYDNIVNLVGNAPVGDLYSELNLFWSSGIASGTSLQFFADTDNATSVVDPAKPVPAPDDVVVINPAKPVPVPNVIAGVVLAASFFGIKESKKRQTQRQKTEA